jgi:hypothetical protein
MRLLIFLCALAILVCSTVSSAKEYVFDLRAGEIEAVLLKKFPNITRDGGVLTIKTDGSTIALKNRPDAGEGTVLYFFVGFVHIHADRTDYVIKVGLWEGRYYMLINGLTGETIDMCGQPIISPDRRRCVAMCLDLEAGYMTNSIQIFRIERDGYELEWEYTFDESEGPSDAVWLDEFGVVFFGNRSRRAIDKPDIYERRPYITEMKDGQWKSPRLLK